MRLFEYLIHKHEFIEIIDEAKKKAKNDTSLTTFTHEMATGIWIAKPDFKLKTGEDIKRAIDEGVIAVATVDKSKNIKLVNDVTKIAQHRYLTKETKLPKNKLADAKSLAEMIVKRVGRQIGTGTVYWTGPTNDHSMYGAADITYKTADGVQPVSLKYGAGQLKNLGLDTLAETLLAGILPKDGKKISDLIYSKTDIWNQLTKDWMKLVYDFVGSNGEYDVAKILKPHLDNTYAQYLKAPITGKQAEVLTPYGYWKDGDKLLIKEVDKRIYTLNKPLHKQWQAIRSKAFEILFTEHFENLEGRLNKNLINLFKIQMSSGKGDMWYAAQGGKKILFIPNSKTFTSLSSKLGFEYTSNASNVGYTLTVNITDGTEKFMKITINIRYGEGQMAGRVTTKSSMSDYDQEQWNAYFGAPKSPAAQ